MVPADRQPATASRIASRTLQVAVAGAVLAGGAVPETLSPLLGVAILAVPPVLGWGCRYRLDPLQRAWVSLGLAVHPLGMLYGLYGLPFYDHLAHAASASLLAGLLYLLATGLLDAEFAFPDRPTAAAGRGLHLLVLAAVLVGGLGWELLELHVQFLVVYGPEDTLADVAYDVVGWLAVAPRWRATLGALPAGLARGRRGRPVAALPAPGGG